MKYCLFCGCYIPDNWDSCPACGKFGRDILENNYVYQYVFSGIDDNSVGCSGYNCGGGGSSSFMYAVRKSELARAMLNNGIIYSTYNGAYADLIRRKNIEDYLYRQNCENGDIK